MGWLRLMLATVVLAAAAIAAAASALDTPIERYRVAAGSREVGSVQGRVFEESRRPTGPEAPLAGTALILLPRSEAWLLRLNGIKRGARDSMETYRGAATAVRSARDAYEKALLEAGAGDLSQGATVDGEGRFVLDAVPAGPWLLLASRTKYINKAPLERAPPAPGLGSSPMRPPLPPLPFVPSDKLAGYSVVTYWLRELDVVAGGVETVDLTDRNAWLTGVVENRMAPKGPDQPYQPRR